MKEKKETNWAYFEKKLKTHNLVSDLEIREFVLKQMNETFNEIYFRTLKDHKQKKLADETKT